jgi:hypothetical protein
VRNPRPLQIKPVTVSDAAVKIELVNSNEFARVHVFATRYEPAYAVCDHLGRIQDREPLRAVLDDYQSFYAAGRKLGDEYRYIIDRRYAQKYPGNMLERPSLLLNPWAIRGTETGQQVAAQGEAFGAEPPASAAALAVPPSAETAATDARFSHAGWHRR